MLFYLHKTQFESGQNKPNLTIFMLKDVDEKVIKKYLNFQFPKLLCVNLMKVT